MSQQDEHTIIKLLNRYGLAMDSRRWDLFDTLFTDDVKLEYPNSSWDNLAQFRIDFARAHEPFDATQHMVSNHLVEVTGDTANAFCYCSFRLIRKGTEGGDTMEGTAWYDDHLVRTAGGWRIKSRACRILWADGNPRATGATKQMDWTKLRVDAAEGRVGYLEAIGAKASPARKRA